MIQARFSLQLGAGRDQSLAVLVAFVLCEVLDEAASQILCLLLPLGSVSIGVAGIQDSGIHAGQLGGNLEVEVGDLLGGSLVDGTAQDGVDDAAGILDGDALAGAVPAGVHQVSLGAAGLHLLHQFLSVLGGMQLQEGLAEASGEGGGGLGDAALGAGQLCGEAGQEVVLGLLRSQDGDRGQDAECISRQEDDILGCGCRRDGADDVLDVVDGVGDAGVLGHALVAGFNPEVTRYVIEKGALMMPGTATPGEMEQAMSMGLDVVKFFPAEQNGGVAKLKALAGPYKTLKWMPTGGVNAKNLADYLAFDQIVACGGTWMVKKDLIQQENWAEITRLSREAVRTMLGFSLDHVGVNCGSEAEADRLARTLCDMFGFAYQMGNSSVQALHAVECTKTPGRGTHGHIAIATSNVDRAVYHLGLCGIRCLPETRKTDAKGNTKAIYIDGEFGGFAIHLVRR